MNREIITAELEQNSSIISEVTSPAPINTVVENNSSIETIVDTNNNPIETQVVETESNIVSIVNQPNIQVTSVNGKTGDVEVDSEVQEFKAGKYYKQGSLITHNGSAYIAKKNMTPTSFIASDWGSVGGGEQGDWNETDTTAPSFIKNKPSIVTRSELATEVNKLETKKADKSGVYTKGESDTKYALKTHTHNYSEIQNAPQIMSQVEANGGTATTNRTISANILKGAIQNHQVQPDWNAVSGKGKILNKPDIPNINSSQPIVTDLQFDDDQMSIRGIRRRLDGQESGVSDSIVNLNPYLPILPKPIYGKIGGRIGSAAQVVPAGATTDLVWDSNRMENVNITYSHDWNGWLIPEDGVYILTAITEIVDVPQPFGLAFQKLPQGGNWQRITNEDWISYPAIGRVKTVTTTQKFNAGDKVNCIIVNGGGNTRVGEGDYAGHEQTHFTITRIDTTSHTYNSVPRHSSLTKEIVTTVNVSNGPSKIITYSFNIPEEFKGRRFKATWKLEHQWRDTDPSLSATAEVYRKEWSPQANGYINDVKNPNIGVRHYHNYNEITELYDNTLNNFDRCEMLIRDRDGLQNNRGLYGTGKVILETF